VLKLLNANRTPLSPTEVRRLTINKNILSDCKREIFIAKNQPHVRESIEILKIFTCIRRIAEGEGNFTLVERPCETSSSFSYYKAVESA
jgi:hypothetical protein